MITYGPGQLSHMVNSMHGKQYKTVLDEVLPVPNLKITFFSNRRMVPAKLQTYLESDLRRKLSKSSFGHPKPLSCSPLQICGKVLVLGCRNTSYSI